MADNKKLKKKIITAAAGTGAVLSILSSAKYDDPIELIKTEIKNADENRIEEKISVTKSIKKEYIVDKIPVILRTAFLLPMWLVGHLLLKVLERTIRLIASPFLYFLLSTLLTFLVLLLIIVLFIKLLYPDLPIRKILNRKVIISTLICSILLNVVDVILIKFVKEYEDIRGVIKYFLGLLVLILLLLNVIKRKIKKASEPIIIYDENIDTVHVNK